MTRYSPDRAPHTRARIVESAAKLVRVHGVDGAGLKLIMESVGMTTGGFYKYFDSKDQLMAEALKAASAPLDELDPAESSLEHALGIYLSREHRDRPGAGCAVAAVITDAGRSGAEVKQAYTEKAISKLDFFEALIGPHQDARALSILVACACLGAVNLSRAIDNEGLSDEILHAVSDQLQRITK
ncbi:TetR/AcrR family transcriptional regulator [Pseudomonas sp. NPDC090203]|uniref:TetR/AcrR family transcriptional regulator n=1 Tax=Pseudomonas sp. NPDC090203 TaxID=3364477 RepID=UPI0038274688